MKLKIPATYDVDGKPLTWTEVPTAKGDKGDTGEKGDTGAAGADGALTASGAGYAINNGSTRPTLGTNAVDLSQAGSFSDHGATGAYSVAEGLYTNAIGEKSHAEGSQTTASGDESHAEGDFTTASGHQSHSEGGSSVASGGRSHAQNVGTIAQGYDQTAIGAYNIAQGSNYSKSSTDYAFIIGNGSDGSHRSNAFTVDWSGNVNIPTGAVYKVNGVAIGAKGDKGDTGLTGATGATGSTGATGAAGKSAYASAQDGGYTDTEANFYADLGAIQGLKTVLEALL